MSHEHGRARVHHLRLLGGRLGTVGLEVIHHVDGDARRRELLGGIGRPEHVRMAASPGAAASQDGRRNGGSSCRWRAGLACGGARFADGDHVLEVRQLARDLREGLE